MLLAWNHGDAVFPEVRQHWVRWTEGVWSLIRVPTGWLWAGPALRQVPANLSSARAIGASPLRIITRHLLPNVAGVIAAVAVLGFAQNLLAESVLSYLGLGPPPPDPTWGRMLFEGRTFYRTAPHLVLAPGLAIVIAVVSFHLLAEWLRSLVDGERAEDRP